MIGTSFISDMNHTDHVYLLEGDPGLRERLGMPLRGTGGTWADLGSGAGAFTLALADLLGPGAVIYSIERQMNLLDEQLLAMRNLYPETRVIYQPVDFTRPLDLPALDGLVMANSLHFIPDHAKTGLLRKFHSLLKPSAQFILVEYNIDRGNMWVPYPLSFTTWKKLAQNSDYTNTSQLGKRPSRFLGEIYSAVSFFGD